MQSESLLEYVLVNCRWVFVVCFLLPCTVVGKIWTVYEKSLWSRRSGLDHEKNVKNIQREVRLRNEYAPNRVMCTAKPSWRSMTLAEMTYKKYMVNINVCLDGIIAIDSETRTVRVEPGIAMCRLIPLLIQSGWTIPVALDMEDLTVGGLVAGIGLESSSFKYGLFHEICTGYELITANGDLITCSKTHNADIFECIPFSYGTLGFLTAIDIKLIPVKKYVKLQYCPIRSLEKIESRLILETSDLENNDFVELLMFNKDEGVLMTGKMMDCEEKSKVKVNEIGRFYKPWFFKHVESFLTLWNNGEEYIPLKDYYFRHNKSLFWEIQDIIPFGNHPLFRYLLGWLMPTKVALLKLTRTNTIKELYDKHHFIDDFIIPISSLKISMNKFHDSLNIYPIWVCPTILGPGNGLMHSQSINNMYLDIGLYGEPKVLGYNSSIAKDLELFVLRLKGFKMMYIGTHLNINEFKTMFDHCLYEKIRRHLKCEFNFPEVYEKVNKNVRK